MNIEIRFGEDTVRLNLPEQATVDHFENTADRYAVSRAQFVEAVRFGEEGIFPIESANLFVVNDAYRPTPTALILNWLADSGKIAPRANILIAAGCHQAPTSEQLRIILGERFAGETARIMVHDARNREMMVAVGKEPTGETVYLNRAFLEAKRVVVIGSVEPHYFAGFTGGRKALFPGLCDFETTGRNHNRAVSFDCRPLRLDGNPVEEHFRSLMKLMPQKEMLAIQTVATSPQKMAAVFCGNINDAFIGAVRRAEEIFGFAATQKYDLILAEVRPPLDSNLYQLQKSLENCQAAVADGGTIILFSPCREGIGSDSFFRLAKSWSPDAKWEFTGTESFGIHKIRRVYELAKRIRIGLYSTLPRGIADRVSFEGIADPQKKIDELLPHAAHLRVAIVHDAGHTVLTSS